MLTNKADLGKVYVPHSLQQTRGVIKLMTKITPTCMNIAKGTVALLGASELAYPLTFGHGQKLGPVTHFVANNTYKCSVPIETRNDSNYESYKADWNECIKKYGLSEIPLPERTQIIMHDRHFLDLGLQKDQIEALKTPGFTAVSTSSKK